MYLVTRGREKAKLATKEDAKNLTRALSDYDCKEAVARQELVGMKAEIAYKIHFDDEELSVCAQDDALIVARWMLSLDCNEVSIKRVNGDA